MGFSLSGEMWLPIRSGWGHMNFLNVTFKVVDCIRGFIKWFKNKRQVIWYGLKVRWEAELLLQIHLRKKREYEIAKNKQSYLAAVWNGPPGCWNIAPGLQRQLARDMAHVRVDQNPFLFSFTVTLRCFHCEPSPPTLTLNFQPKQIDHSTRVKPGVMGMACKM